MHKSDFCKVAAAPFDQTVSLNLQVPFQTLHNNVI